MMNPNKGKINSTKNIYHLLTLPFPASTKTSKSWENRENY